MVTRLKAGRHRFMVQLLAGTRNRSLLHPASYSMGSMGLFARIKPAST